MLALWVSDPNGKSMREIGHMPTTPWSRLGQRFAEISNIQWLPGGRRLSFIYRNSLWTVLVD